MDLKEGFARTFTQDKLKAFQTGTINMSNPSLKRVHEENKKKQDEKAAAEVYKEFVSSFDEKNKLGKAFVRGEVVNALPDQINVSKTPQTGQLYQPGGSKFLENLIKEPKSEKKKKEKDKKKKSNLELFKEELQKMQEEREERNKLKQEIRETINKGGKVDPFLESWLAKDKDDEYYSQIMKSGGTLDHWDNDPSTTNLFLSNLNPKVNEEMLCEMFGEFGPLASVKIMWPRSEEEISRNKNCGFVAYMNRKDGDRALKKLQGVDLAGYEMKLGWGKPVPIPPHPIYIPPHMIELTLPPPPSGLPFNAQPPTTTTRRGRNRHDSEDSDTSDSDNYAENETSIHEDDLFIPAPGKPLPPSDPMEREKFEKTLRKSVVRVVIPTERPLLCLIHRMIEFVVREGPRFEAMIMNRELKNPMFRFLFDNKSPAHVYYRWKLYSILNGESPSEWSTKRFRLFKGGSWWLPPPINMFGVATMMKISPQPFLTQISNSLAGTELSINPDKDDIKTRRHQEPRELLSKRQRVNLEGMLRKLSTKRDSICDCMIFCIDHAEAATEIVECLHQALSLNETPLAKKLARVYLISDILYNCSCKAHNVSYFRKSFQVRLPEIFKELNKTFTEIKSKVLSDQFRQKMINCLKCWEEWDIFPNDLIIKLQCIFLGLDISQQSVSMPKPQDSLLNLINNPNNLLNFNNFQSPLAGIFESNIPFDDDIDGTPLLDKNNAALSIFEDIYPVDSDSKKEVITENHDLITGPGKEEEDIDGMPFVINETITQNKIAQNASFGSFIKSKWEEVDEETLQTQVMTTSKWDMLEEPELYVKELENSPILSQTDETSPSTNNQRFQFQNSNQITSKSKSVSDFKEDGKNKTLRSSSDSKLKVVDYEVDEEETDNTNLGSSSHKTGDSSFTDARRLKLREIEVKVMKYQDDIENGKVSKKSGLSTIQQVQRYREKLIDQDKLQENKSNYSTSKRHQEDLTTKAPSSTHKKKRSPSVSTSSRSHSKSKKNKQYEKKEDYKKSETSCSSNNKKKHHR